MVYTVGEMAKLLGVPASTLRYYDKEGLLPFVERSPGGRRSGTTDAVRNMPPEEIPEPYRAARTALRQLPKPE